MAETKGLEPVAYRWRERGSDMDWRVTTVPPETEDMADNDIEPLYSADAIERLTQERDELERMIYGWREYDWPEGFDRHTAQLIADNVRDHMERLKR